MTSGTAYLDHPKTMSSSAKKTNPTKKVKGTLGQKSFTAVLEPLRNGLGWVIARIPFDVETAWPHRVRQRVRGEVEGVPFRSSLFGFSQGGGHFLLVNNKLQKAAKVTIGSRVRIEMEPDMDERLALMPPELAAVLKSDRELRRYFDGLNEYTRRTICALVQEPTSLATRQKRAEQWAERLMLTMEGEQDVPPILRAAFLREPLAKKGWELMTQLQRRGHLLGIFYYKEGEAREKRAAKAVEEALRVAKKRPKASEE
jgi:uncharacterized protein YdeI (YjbR/CyaY-like superfamily)